jgi:hypothetical protein
VFLCGFVEKCCKGIKTADFEGIDVVVETIQADVQGYGCFLRGCMGSKGYLKVYVPPIPLPTKRHGVWLLIGVLIIMAAVQDW